MRRHVWQRVVPHRRFHPELLPGLLLFFSSVGVVSAAAINHKHSWHSSSVDQSNNSDNAIHGRQGASHHDSPAPDATASKNPASAPAADGTAVSALPINQTQRQMYFIGTPATSSDAQSVASDVASFIKSLPSPETALIIIEPTLPNGSNLDFNAYHNGAYDGALNSMFADIKAQGVSDIGMWVFFPEANTPSWGNTDPATVAANITRSVTIQKKYFPNSQASIMLDSETYAASDADWANGQYTSLLPYLQGIPAGLINSFGYQGFPWAPAAGVDQSTSLDASQFLPPNLAIEAAHALGVSSIWLNTGSFGAMYTNDPGQTISQSPAQRTATLGSIYNLAASLRANGFSMAVNIFAENKANQDEAVDWSYSGLNASVLTAFTSQLRQDAIAAWVYQGQN